MDKIINKLTNNVCQISCGTHKGTGFLCSKSFVLTAFHVVKKYKNTPIELTFGERRVLGKLHKSIDEKYKRLDIAILELDSEVDFYLNINFEDINLLPNMPWISRGYPNIKESTGTNLIDNNNYINQQLKILKNHKIDIELNMSQTFYSYKGLSGAPLVISDRIVGIINTELEENGIAKELYALSFKHFKDLIDEVTFVDNNIEKETIEIIKDDKKFGEITINTVNVPIESKNYSLNVSIYPVTFQEYDLYCEYKMIKKAEDRKWDEREKRPAIYVSLKNAKDYCKWLNKFSISKKYQLLSSTDWLIIADLNRLNINSEDEIWYNKKETAKIGKTKVGKLGICDMYGNTEEWCSDKVSIGASFRSFSLTRMRERIPRKKSDEFDFVGFRIAAIEKG